MTVAAPVEPARASAPRADEVLTPEAVDFVGELDRRFGSRRRELLEARAERQARIDAGELPDFLPETRQIREGDWTIDPVPAGLIDRRVEITGPTDRKTVINALNSGARTFMVDFEDASSPTWANVVEGQTLSAWLRGSGAVAINRLMEDAATAEIARSQVWQWVRQGRFDRDHLLRLIHEAEGDETAREIFEQVTLGDELVEFLTLPAYDHLERGDDVE